MKCVRFGPRGREKPGLIDADGRVRDLSAHIEDFSGAFLSRKVLTRLARLKPEKLPPVRGKPRLGPPVGRMRHFFGVGLNYTERAQEMGMVPPHEPLLFNKAPSCVNGAHDEVPLPPGAEKTDWEVALAVIIGERASHLRERDALSVVAGYAVCNDISERGWQMEGAGQWLKGKSSPGFGPLGPWMVTPDEVGDPQQLCLWLDLNGKRMQQGSTATMIFPVAHLIAFASRFMVLEPGDVIITGTPPGVGMGRKPPVFLRPGDIMRLGIDKLGEQKQVVTPWAG